MANNKIEAIQKHIDLQSSRSKQQATAAAQQKLQAKASVSNLRNGKDTDEKSGEDFRTALQNAITCLRELDSITQSSSGSSKGESSSSGDMKTAEAIETDRRRVSLMNKLTDILRRHLRVRYELKTSDLLKTVEPCLADKCSKHCRAVAYRLIRQALVDSEAVTQLGRSLDWYFVKSLQRDNKHAQEKEQALKLIRTIIEVSTTHRDGSIATNVSMGNVQLSEVVMRAIIAVAEHPEDPFRPICIQTLTEILLMDIELLVRSGGFKVLLHVLGEGPSELTPIIASAFLHIVDSPRTRVYLCVGTDLELALSAITDAYGKGPDQRDKIKACAKVVQLMLRTWSGLMYFCLDDMRAIRSLVDTLRIPSLETRDVILDMFFDLLNIKTPEWYKTFIDGRRLTMYRRRSRHQNQQKEPENPDRPHQTLKLTDQYLALLVVILTNAGLCDALTSMMEETTMGTNLSRKATLLMAEILAMSNRVLPLSVAGKIQAIPQIFAMATDYANKEHRIVGTSAVSAIDSFNRNKARLETNNMKNNPRPRANSVEDAVRRGQRHVEQAKLKMSMQMDDKTFQTAMLETQVILTKDHTKWNFEALQALIEGPLLSPKRMEEATRVSRFIRRLMSFYLPFNRRFSDMKRTKLNTRWVRLGCSLMNTLMATAEGVKYLSTEDQLLSQITRAFAQLDPFNGGSETDPIFSKKRVADTLTYGYLEMLGTLSKYKDGIELLEKFKIFTAFYHLSELRSREDLIKGIVDNLDYSIDGHSRIVLSKALTSSYKHIRLYATRHLGLLIRNSPTANAWTLRLLLTQLYDPATEVCELAVHFLEEACESKEILQLLVEMQPTMDHLGEIGHPLLLKFMSTPMGFRYLYDAGYIDREMDIWFNERNIYYVVQVEVFLAKVFSAGSNQDDDDDLLAFDGTVPPHFYGEMSKTELGCQILQEKGHFSDFAQFIRQHSHESEDPDLIMKLKSILWAVGNVGATEGGLHFLEEEEVIPAVLEILERSPIPSVRGTCFFVLGLISCTSQGAEILDDYHWESTLSPLGFPTGICIPADVDRFLSIAPWVPKVPISREPRLLPPTADHEIEIITAIQNLANTVIANAASRSLARLKVKSESKAAFQSPEMFYRALHIISTQRYRFPVRRYIVDLFNLELNPELRAAFDDAAKKLESSPSHQPPKVDPLRHSVFGRLPSRHGESDESDGDDGISSPPPRTVTAKTEDKPAFSLEPRSRIVGFAS
ncbi:ste16 [Coprinopsis cinerea AmutBmut pab1-1]|nr:ste16 [Coprinopsis cinerea AmutBmut pab1-1]